MLLTIIGLSLTENRDILSQAQLFEKNTKFCKFAVDIADLF